MFTLIEFIYMAQNVHYAVLASSVITFNQLALFLNVFFIGKPFFDTVACITLTLCSLTFADPAQVNFRNIHRKYFHIKCSGSHSRKAN